MRDHETGEDDLAHAVEHLCVGVQIRPHLSDLAVLDEHICAFAITQRLVHREDNSAAQQQAPVRIHDRLRSDTSARGKVHPS